MSLRLNTVNLRVLGVPASPKSPNTINLRVLGAPAAPKSQNTVNLRVLDEHALPGNKHQGSRAKPVKAHSPLIIFFWSYILNKTLDKKNN